MQIPILYEDKNILAINKPVGLIVHGDGKSDRETLVDWLLENYPEIKDVGESMFLNDETGTEIKRPGIVHRLDKDTSGVMLIAKTAEAVAFLKNKFKEREIEKTYHAFVYGNIKEEELTIDAPIGRNKDNIRKWTSGKGARGEMRDALTEVKVLERGEVGGERVTFIEAKPKTGRTHQIRVHLNYASRPIVCDSLYTKRACILGFDRVALHAFSISFTGMEGETIIIEALHPDDFRRALQLLVK